MAISQENRELLMIYNNQEKIHKFYILTRIPCIEKTTSQTMQYEAGCCPDNKFVTCFFNIQVYYSLAYTGLQDNILYLLFVFLKRLINVYNQTDI